MASNTQEEWLISAQQELGVKFPEKYTRKILNGDWWVLCDIDGERWVFHPFFDQTDRESIIDTSNHVLYETKEWRKYSNFPPNAVSIAQNNEGDTLILMPDETNPEKLKETIYIHRHDEDMADITKVAESIEDLEEVV